MYTALIIVIVLIAAALLYWLRRRHHGSQWPTATVYSASDSYGGYIVDGQLERYDPDPVELISMQGPVQCINWAANGQRLTEMIAGGPLENGLPPILEVDPFVDRLAQDATEICIIGCGMVDALFGDLPVQDYRDLLHQAHGQARAAGKLVVFRGFHNMVINDTISAAQMQRHNEFDAALRSVCVELSAPYIDLAGVTPEMAQDGLHPTMNYHERLSREIAKQLKAIAQSI
jgi:lysophospholipase L1-like esterase